MDVFILIVCIVMSIVLIIVSIYIMAFYSHVDDQFTITSTLCKIIVVITLAQCLLQQLILALDVSNSRGNGAGFNMNLIWKIFYLSAFANLGFLLPFAVYLYQSDEQKSICQRILVTTCQVIITIGVVCILAFVSYLYLNQALIPIQLITTNNMMNLSNSTSQNIIEITPVANSVVELQLQIGIPYYIMGIMCFLGYIILVLCGGCGLSALPLDLIMQFRMRPRWIRTSQANQKKKELSQTIHGLIETGQRLKKKIADSDFETGWWSKRKYNMKVQQQYEQYQSLVMLNKDRYQLFKLQLDMTNTNPIVFILKLILGIISIFITLIWWFQLLFSQLIMINGLPFLNIMDKIFLYFQLNNANFFSIILFMVFTIYLVFCILKGIFTFGVSIPFVFSFHPMKQGRTWMNSFLFNLALSALGCIAIVHICVNSFPQYTRNTVIQLIFVNQINHLKFFKLFFEKKVFIYAFIIWSALISIFVIIRGVKKPDILKQIQQKRKKLKMVSVEIQMQQLPKDKKSISQKEKSTKSAKSKRTIKSKNQKKKQND